jgi:hypothetical protein
LGPYNEHLVRDVGALNLALGVLLATAALLLERRLVQVSLIAYLVYAVPHFAFHLVKGNALPRRQRREHGHAGDRGPTPARSSCSWPFAQRRAKATSHRRLREARTRSPSARGKPYGGVEADDLAVEHLVLNYVAYERGELFGATEALREEDLLAQRLPRHLR